MTNTASMPAAKQLTAARISGDCLPVWDMAAELSEWAIRQSADGAAGRERQGSQRTAYDNRMTEQMTLMQARLSEKHARQVDQDIATLGLRSRSEAVREGLKLLHRQAAHAALAREYDDFYGNAEAPVSDVTAIGDEVAVEAMSADDAGRE